MAYEDSLLRRPFFPSGEKLKEYGSAILGAFTPAAGTPPPTMAGVTVPPAGASLSQLQFGGALINRPYSEPSVRPDFRNPAEQWDARTVSTPLSRISPWPVFRGTQRTPEQIASDEAYLSRRQPQIARATMSPQTVGVVDVFRGNAGAINAQYTPTLPQTTLSKYSVPNVSAPQLGIGMSSQIGQINFPATFGAAQPAQQLPSIQQQVPFQRTAVKTPYGTIYATSEAPRGQQSQVQLLASRPTAIEGRTPREQQALLADMRGRGADLMRKNLIEQEKIIAQRRANPELYTTPSGSKIAAPTNMYGQPIESWRTIYRQASNKNDEALAGMKRLV
jgi:hypothetical protein